MPDDNPVHLPVAGSADRPLPALADSFPRSTKLEKGEFGVPFRRIELDGEPALEVYDTTGPQGFAPERGLPPRRLP